MISRCIDWCAQNRFLVFTGTLLLVLAGTWSLRRIPLDALPDISDVQVIVHTPWAGQPPSLVRTLMHSKIRAVDEQIRNLLSLRVELNRLSKDWDKRLRRTKPGQAARLLEAAPLRPRAGVASGLPKFQKKKGQ